LTKAFKEIADKGVISNGFKAAWQSLFSKEVTESQIKDKLKNTVDATGNILDPKKALEKLGIGVAVEQ
jgi:hypothetical protein